MHQIEPSLRMAHAGRAARSTTSPRIENVQVTVACKVCEKHRNRCPRISYRRTGAGYEPIAIFCVPENRVQIRPFELSDIPIRPRSRLLSTLRQRISPPPAAFH
ncbi:hypothetical protein G647_08627 [Cladophialophora carrionii CBS 160.54]|uniref:Uncharacterized protein n=1 Tax=Cladophialophora carrionii CBS 160.54 TaxID=1279043 RepID=V9D0Y0_9EURO|nr:uncharacterized protein G647_08627 [Cladophialophora carrionii CBS 160.54]ETI20589.1 hypothetical protein G647_08627 [Cladophialophora carrionii CBS 160.54]